MGDLAAKGIRSTAVAALLLVAAPSAAHAGTAEAPSQPSRQFQQLRYTAAAGERNQLDVTLSGGAYLVEDAAGVTAGAGCAQQGPTQARCAVVVNPPTRPALSLGDADDEARLSGTGARIDGGDGNDALTGGPSTDVLVGGAGQDSLSAGPGRTRDRLDGGAGEDRLEGSGGANRLTGGSGVDTIRAGGGRDRILARDRFADLVSCGGGRDRAALDGLDWFRSRCERVSRSSSAGATLLDISSRRNSSVARIVIGCPGDVRACRGRLRLRQGRRTLGVGRFRIRRGGRRVVAIRLPSDVRRTLEARDGMNVTVVLFSRTGRRTRTVTLREFLAAS